MSDPVTTMIHAAVIQLRAEASVVGVGFDGRVAFASRGHLLGNQVDPDTVFYAASITKQMVAVLLAQAAVNQTIDVEDRIVHRLPELPAWMADVRLHHLIHHTSDLPDVSDPTLGVPTSNRVVISRFQHVRPAQAPRPGAHYAYNNAGYVLLAEALSRTLGKSVSEMAYTQLFTRLGLLHTRLGGEAVSLTTVLDPPALSETEGYGRQQPTSPPGSSHVITEHWATKCTACARPRGVSPTVLNWVMRGARESHQQPTVP